MKPTLCSKCKKNLAVVFITKIENGQTDNEGYCLKCARELGIKPVDDMISRMGLSDEDLDNLNGEMLDTMNGLEGLISNAQNPDDTSEDEEDDDNASQTATFPFLNKLFGNAGNNNPGEALSPQKEEPRRQAKRTEEQEAKIPRYLLPESHAEGARREARPHCRPRRGNRARGADSEPAAEE